MHNSNPSSKTTNMFKLSIRSLFPPPNTGLFRDLAGDSPSLYPYCCFEEESTENFSLFQSRVSTKASRMGHFTGDCLGGVLIPLYRLAFSFFFFFFWLGCGREKPNLRKNSEKSLEKHVFSRPSPSAPHGPRQAARGKSLSERVPARPGLGGPEAAGIAT